MGPTLSYSFLVNAYKIDKMINSELIHLYYCRIVTYN